jgi:hypothetical protein
MSDETGLEIGVSERFFFTKDVVAYRYSGDSCMHLVGEYACPKCGEKTPAHVHGTAPDYWDGRNRVMVMRCDACRTVFPKAADDHQDDDNEGLLDQLRRMIDDAWFADAEAVPYEAQPDVPPRGPSSFVVLR